jgi:branched-subunit amino acid transport protein
MSLWLTIVLAGVVTFGIRFSFIYMQGRVSMPDWFQRGLRFVPVAVLSAIILPELASHGGAVDLSLRNPQLLAGTTAMLVAWRTKNVLLTIIAGLVALLIFQALLAAI